MDYELLNSISGPEDVWARITARAKAHDAQILCLSPNPNLSLALAKKQVEGTSIIDRVTARSEQDLTTYRFFNQGNIPYMAQTVMYSDGSIYVHQNEEPIAREYLVPNTRRQLQDIRYLNADETLDYIEEYGVDGTVYTNLFYTKGELQEINFYDQRGRLALTFYYYEGKINYIVERQPENQHIVKTWPNRDTFFNDQLKQLLTANDKVSISYLGTELNVLEGTVSRNSFVLSETPLDDSGEVRGNLREIMLDNISYIQEVHVTREDYDVLAATGLPMDKVKIVED